jgi:solute:Na+ symporter, SSS family
MGTLHVFDWCVIGFYLALTLALGLYFTRRAGKDLDSFFASNHSLPWYLSGVSLIATSFASDTPLWITSLVRQHGVHYIWQFWAPAIGGTLAVVLFARLWRRVGVLTDIEFVEFRYSGKGAAVLRFWTAITTALLLCPLIIGWVTMAMEIITREAMGLPPEFRVWTTALVVVVALLSCALSGLWGVVYTDFLQFILAVIGTTALAYFSIQEVGGIAAMVEKLGSLDSWPGNRLQISPEVGPAPGQMSIWNFIGYFGFLWVSVAQSGGFQAQRLLACKNERHASFAMLTLSTLYYGVICWPWIIVALCSLLLFPDLGAGTTHDLAYPRMIVTLMPVGLKGLLLVAMLSAFMSTISTLFNWGASYLVNDVYKRFLVKEAVPHHYVNVGRVTTVIMAVLGGIISMMGSSIQELLTIAFVFWSGAAMVQVIRWFWWRMNAWGELAGTVTCYGMTGMVIFWGLLDHPFQSVFGITPNFSDDPNLLGARMALVVGTVTLVSILVSFLTPPTDKEHLKAFVLKVRPIGLFWKPVIASLGGDYTSLDHVGRTLCGWALSLTCVVSLIYAVGKLFLGSSWLGAGLLVLSGTTLWLTVRHLDKDFGPDH